MLVFADVALTLLHALIVLANLVLWIPKRTRRWHLPVVGLTALSWFTLGPLLGRGLGYCFLTDWHWQLKHALGQRDLPSSFIMYLFEGIGVDARAWANPLTFTLFISVTLVSVALNLRDWRRARRRRTAPR